MRLLRDKVDRYTSLVRLALLVVALYSVLPAQLVWCHEDGRTPRIETGFNGQCLQVAASLHRCCAAEHAGSTATPAAVPAVFDAGCARERCIDCSDQPAHHQQQAQSASPQLIAAHAAGGVLFLLADLDASVSAPLVACGDGWGQCIPGLPLLCARTTCLLI